MKKTKLFKSLLVAAGLCVGASAWAQTWTFKSNTDVWGVDGVTLKGGNQYDENANAVTSGGVTFTGTNGFVSTALGIGFNTVGSYEDENISVVVPAGYKATVTIYTSNNRTVKAKLGNGDEQTYNASWAATTKEFSNAEGTEDLTLIMYCNQNPGGSNQKQAPFLQSIVLADMATVKSFPWTANAVATIGGTKTVIKTYSSGEGTVDEGSQFAITVDKAILYDGAYYVLNDTQFGENVYGKTFTMGSEAPAYEFSYELLENVAFYGEAEDIYYTGSRSNKQTGITVLSNGGGYSAMGTEGYVTLKFTVPETAVYKLSLGMNNTNSTDRGFNYSIDGADVSNTITVPKGSAHVEEITEQTLKKGEHTIKMNITYSLTPVFDYLLITKTGEAAKSTFTAKYYNSKGWEKVYAYTFNGETLGGWAGKELTAGENGLYDVTFESVDAPEKIIFNNGSSNTDEVKTNQTGDLDFVDGAAYCFDGQGEVYSFTFTTNKGWSNIYAYTWSGENENKVEQLGAWKGTQINDGRLTFVATTAPEKIIFNNGEGTQSPEMVFTNGEAYTYNSTYVVAGVEAVFGVAWDKDAEANKLDENNQLTITGITLAKGDYEYQVVADGDWNTKTVSKYLGVKMDGKYDIVITFDPATKEVTDAMAVYKSISGAGYATYCSPYALDFTGVEGLTAYVASIANGKVSFTAVDKVPANTGVLLKGAAGEYTINTTTDGGNATSALIGVLESKEVPAGSYVLMNGGAGVGFYKANSAFTVGANTAYLPATAGARSFIAIDGEATAIEGIAAEKAQDGVIYNLQGQRVMKAQKGLYIIDGKKVMVK